MSHGICCTVYYNFSTEQHSKNPTSIDWARRRKAPSTSHSSASSRGIFLFTFSGLRSVGFAHSAVLFSTTPQPPSVRHEWFIILCFSLHMKYSKHTKQQQQQQYAHTQRSNVQASIRQALLPNKRRIQYKTTAQKLHLPRSRRLHGRWRMSNTPILPLRPIYFHSTRTTWSILIYCKFNRSEWEKFKLVKVCDV